MKIRVVTNEGEPVITDVRATKLTLNERYKVAAIIQEFFKAVKAESPLSPDGKDSLRDAIITGLTNFFMKLQNN